MEFLCIEHFPQNNFVYFRCSLFYSSSLVYSNNELNFAVYRRQTHTGIYLNSKNNNPILHKRSVAYILFKRSKSDCDPVHKSQEDKIR